MKRKLSFMLTLILVGFGFANVAAHKMIRIDRSGILQRYSSPKSQINSDLLQILAGEFKGLAADYLLLEVGSFLGSNQPADGRDWHNVYLTLKQALVLDPYFQQTYLYAQGQLPWQGKMPRKADELLEISRDRRPWDWYPGQYIGFNAYYFYNDFAKASEAFLRAAKIKGAPGILAALGARFAIKGQRTAAAIALLQTKLQDDDLDAYQTKSIRKRLHALQGIFLLEQALMRYREKHGIYPNTLEELVVSGIIAQMPANPYAEHFFYNPGNGRISFDKIEPKKATRDNQ